MTELARKVLIIAGPTASGKSSLAIDAAKIFNGVVVITLLFVFILWNT